MSETLRHTGLWAGSLPTAVLTCGDPERAATIAGFLENAAPVTRQREYHTFRGEYRGVPLAVCSHGIGAPGAAIAFEEMIIAGARRILRVGTCGSLQPDILPGHLVIASAAVQQTGYGREVVPSGYPPVADLDLTIRLRQTAVASDHPHQTGIVLTRDAFFTGVATPDAPVYAVQSAANVLAVEMECAALFLIGSLRRAQTGAILAVDGQVFAAPETPVIPGEQAAVLAKGLTAAIKIALNTLADLETDELE